MSVFVETIKIGFPAPNNNDDSDDLESPALPSRDNTVSQNSESNTGATQEIRLITLINYRFIHSPRLIGVLPFVS